LGVGFRLSSFIFRLSKICPLVSASRCKSLVWHAVFLFVSLPLYSAQQTPTTVSFSFTNPVAPVYDLTGSYQFEQQVIEAGGATVPLILGLTLTQDVAGRLHGSGTTTVQIGNGSESATYALSGRISGGGKLTRVALVVRWVGVPATAGARPPFNILVQYNLQIAPDGLAGTARGSAKLGQLGNGAIKSAIAGVPLPPGADGSWNLSMNIVPLSRLGGTGSIVLPGGRSLQTSLFGSFSRPSGLSRVALTGLNSDRGAKLSIAFFPSNGVLQKLTGRFMGQSVSMKSGLNIVGQTIPLSAPSTQAGSSQLCAECHGQTFQTVMSNGHGQAGVQCENCHGAAASHAANSSDPTTIPSLPVAAAVCGECHSRPQHPAFDQWSGSAHAHISADMNPTNLAGSCARCHSGTAQPVVLTQQQLSAAGVTSASACISCHDPHGSNTWVKATLAASLCGECHSGPRHPVFEEWTASAHTQVVEDLNPTNVISSCGQCHSGSVRISLLRQDPLPFGSADIGIVCATCHDTHDQHVWTNALSGVFAFSNALSGRTFVFTNTQIGALYTNQLRNPLASTNDYFITTSGVFTNQYNPNVNACAQCHNHRGASWTSSSRPPHSSLQYNMLLGTVGEMSDGSAPNFPAEHSRIENQCVACHMQRSAYQSDAQPAVTGHTFEVASYNACIPCHGNYVPLLVGLTQGAVSNQVQQVKADLDLWATTLAPASLQAAYGARAWEYTNPGSLSSGGPGPTNATQQALIPINIQKARFNLYLVVNDGSLGIHNPFYALKLLDAADAWVQEEIGASGN
jgi:cytochrome c553